MPVLYCYNVWKLAHELDVLDVCETKRYLILETPIMAKSQNVHDKRPLRPSPCLELEQTTVNGKCIRFHLWRAGLVRAWVGTRASPHLVPERSGR